MTHIATKQPNLKLKTHPKELLSLSPVNFRSPPLSPYLQILDKATAKLLEHMRLRWKGLPGQMLELIWHLY